MAEIDRSLTYEQMEAAFYLVSSDLCFIWQDSQGGPFVRSTEIQPYPGVKYSLGPNLNDTFYYACADTEVIPWEEVVAVAGHLRTLADDTERNWWLTDWATKKRGHDPKIPQVLAKLNEWRQKWKDAAK